jgi:hypothetical protein
MQVTVTEAENGGHLLEWPSCGENYKYQILRGGVLAETTDNRWTLAADQVLKSNMDAYVINVIDKSTGDLVRRAFYTTNLLSSPIKATKSGDSLILSWERYNNESNVCGYYIYKNGKVICTTITRKKETTGNTLQCVDNNLSVGAEAYLLMVTCIDDRGSYPWIGHSIAVQGCDY